MLLSFKGKNKTKTSPEKRCPIAPLSKNVK